MTDIIWIALEIITNICQGFLCAYFCLKFLTPKPDTNVKVYMLLTGGVQAILLTAMNYLSIFEGIGSILYWIELFIFAYKLLNGNLVKKALASALPLLAAFLVATAVVNFTAALNNMSISEVVLDRSIVRIAVLFSTLLLDYFSYKIILKLFNTDDEQFKISEWGFIIAAAVVSIIMAALLYTVSINIDNNRLRIVINILVLVLLVFDTLLFHLVNSLIKKNKSLNELEMLKLHEQYQLQYIENANFQYDSVKKIRHDMKNQFLTTYTLLNEGRPAEALNYIEKNIDRIQNIETAIVTNSSIANAIVNSKLSMASAMKISTSCFSVSSFDGIDDIDLCNLLSNSLDNAISACKKIPEDEKRLISLKITEESGIYTFLIQNSVKAPVLNGNPNLLSDKQDKQIHGYGTKILTDIADKYGGRCDFYEKNNMFCCKVILKAKTKGL